MKRKSSKFYPPRKFGVMHNFKMRFLCIMTKKERSSAQLKAMLDYLLFIFHYSLKPQAIEPGHRAKAS